MSQIELDFAVAALADYDENGHAQIQTDSPGEDGKAGTEPAQALLPLGFHARPLDPDKGPDGEVGLGANLLTITVGDHRYVIPLGDPREASKLPKVRKGGTMVAGGAGEQRSFMMIEGQDPSGAKHAGSITIAASYTKDGKKKTLGLSLNVRNAGKEEASIVHGNGQRITLGENSVTISNAKGDAYCEVGDDGNVLAGDSRVQGSLVVGEQAAQPVAIGPVVAACFTALAAAVAPALGAQGAPAAILPFISLMNSKHLKAT